MNQRFNHILNNLESRVDLFNLKKELLSKSLNHVIKQEAKKESEIKKQKATHTPLSPSFEKTGWIPGALSYPWIISFLFIPEIIKNLN